MDVVTGIADHAAAQSDRWMFVAMLAIFLVSMLSLAKWFIGDRKGLADRLTAVTDRHIEHTAKLSEVVTNNTVAMNRISDKIDSLEENCAFNRRAQA